MPTKVMNVLEMILFIREISLPNYASMNKSYDIEKAEFNINPQKYLEESEIHSKGRSTGGFGCSIIFRFPEPGALPSAAHSNKATK